MLSGLLFFSGPLLKNGTITVRPDLVSVNLIQKFPHAQPCVSMVILDPVKLTVSISHPLVVHPTSGDQVFNMSACGRFFITNPQGNAKRRQGKVDLIETESIRLLCSHSHGAFPMEGLLTPQTE